MLRTLHMAFVLITVASFLIGVSGWNEWDYNVQWAEDENKITALQNEWHSYWDLSKFKGIANPPRARRGHSLHLIKTDERFTEYGGHTYIVLFGGRDNDQKATHIPKTYDVDSVNGTIVFTTYDERPVNPCNDPANDYYSVEEQKEANCNFTSASLVDIGLIYNDVWAYKLCNPVGDNPERGFDTPCKETGWLLWHAGAPQGGCSIQLGIEVCTVPSERYNHASVMHDDGTLYVYGGFSQRCADYCDDIWFFDIYQKGWRQVYSEGQLTKFYSDTWFEVLTPNNRKHVPIDNTTSKFAGPGKRWRHSMQIARAKENDLIDGTNYTTQRTAIFGGHRLWQGYSPENSQTNNWGDYETRPIGGYLDDLWIYTKVLDFSTPGQLFRGNNGKWEKKEPVKQCFSTPGVAWEDRNDISCKIVRPVGRAGHGSAFDWRRERVWIFGGFTSYYPYLRTDGAGSGPGVTSVGSGGFIPYPGYDYFRNDLWYYDLHKSLWIEVVPEDGFPVPEPRMDAVFLLVGDLLFLHGGFADNFIYDDTWYFNITSSRWLQKKEFVRPIYPPTCTDDFDFIHHNNCTELYWPKHLERNTTGDDRNGYFNILDYKEQPFYWPKPTDSEDYEPYYGIFDKDFLHADYVKKRVLQVEDTAPVGTPMFPYAATGVMQYTRPYIYMLNGTIPTTIQVRCTSAYAEPTRGKKVDGLYGRSNGSVLIATPRPRRPGWDGCRHRYDDRTDLPAGLQYVQPLPRYSHRAVFHENTSEILMYGGMAYNFQQPKSLSDTWESSTLSDMWYYNLNHCSNNCTGHGDCYFGFCKCHVGYYGSDCSNTSCPGTYCYYDEYTNEQNCTHACQAGYIHTDNDTYVQDIYKIPCTRDNWGESNGICNGFGQTMCAPPFLGDDCGTKDCKNNCSFNGWCSVEYPVSRCLCVPGYFGDICEKKLCLNNCSYPNGECQTDSGWCKCNMMYSPYNNTREYAEWNGTDCSYLLAYAAAMPSPAIAFHGWAVLLLLILVVHLSLPVDALLASESQSVLTPVQYFYQWATRCKTSQ